MENVSDKGVKFGFGKPDAGEDKQNDVKSPVEENIQDCIKPTEEVKENDEDLDKEYVDKRSITIVLVKNYSLYRKANDKTLPKRVDYLGSSCTSSRILSSNKEEVEAYFPNIIGLAPNNDNFVTRVKNYLNNIRIPVNELGRKFDTSFRYHHKKDYYAFKHREEEIEDKYKMINRQDIKSIKEALREKINDLNNLESEKYRYGNPVNVEDYLMYRHCLLYRSVAKDTALINSDASIRFAFKDDKKEADNKRKYRISVNKAKTNYVTCLADDILFDAVYIQYCIINNLPIVSSLAEDRLEREIKLDKFSTDFPEKFNAIVNNKDIKLIATIEKLIARGELIRSPYNQNITSVDGEFIGANTNEAVVWFKNPNNTSIVNAYYNKLKNI